MVWFHTVYRLRNWVVSRYHLHSATKHLSKRYSAGRMNTLTRSLFFSGTSVQLLINTNIIIKWSSHWLQQHGATLGHRSCQPRTGRWDFQLTQSSATLDKRRLRKHRLVWWVSTSRYLTFERVCSSHSNAKIFQTVPFGMDWRSQFMTHSHTIHSFAAFAMARHHNTIVTATQIHNESHLCAKC